VALEGDHLRGVIGGNGPQVDRERAMVVDGGLSCLSDRDGGKQSCSCDSDELHDVYNCGGW